MTALGNISKRLGTPISLESAHAKKQRKADIKASVEAKFPRIEPSALSAAAQLGNLPAVVNELTDRIQGFRSQLVENDCLLQEYDLSSLDLHLSAIKNIIGDRTVDTDPRTIMDRLAALSQEVVDLDTSTKDLEKSSLTAAEQQGLSALFAEHTPSLSGFSAKLFKGVVASFHPLMSWISGWTQDKTGGLINAKLADIESRLNKGSPSSAIASSNTAFDPLRGMSRLNLGGSSSVDRGTNNLTKSTIEELTRRVEDISETIKIMREESDTKSVFIVNQAFHSRVDILSWLKLHANNEGGYLQFVDPHALLALAFRSAKDIKEELAMDASSTRAGYFRTEAALVGKSFAFRIPEVFTKGSKLSDPKLLPAIPTFQSFDGETPMSGFKYDFDCQVILAADTITAEAERMLSTTGSLLALKCLGDAQMFLSKLITWIMSTYHTLQKISPDSSEDNWKYVSHCVRTIFEYLHDARKIGAGRNVHGSYVMWACLQGRRAAAELMDKGFSGHPAVEHVLNIHMQRRALMKDEYAKEKKTIDLQFKHLSNEVSSLKGAIDKGKKKQG